MSESRIAVSTAWNGLRHTSGREMIRELQDLGFDSFELNVFITPGMAEEILPMAQSGEISVSSLHNYFPLPPGIEQTTAGLNVIPISSLDPEEHALAVATARNTIRWAAKLGASVVVMHLGIIPGEWRQRKALEVLDSGRPDEARAIVAEDLVERSTVSRPYVDSVIASLRELSGDAESAGVKLGLETRYYYTEIPQLDEFQAILDGVDSPAVGYWHDTGHAQVMQYLGVATQEDYLDRYGSRLVGMHIHDCVGGSDHRAIGKGNIDFAKILSYAKPDTELVLEIHSRWATGDGLSASHESIRSILNSL